MDVENYKFKKGQKFHLDSIYSVQGLGGGDWWEHEDDCEYSDNVIITKTIEIKINVKITD